MTWNTITPFADGNVPAAADLNKIVENFNDLHSNRQKASWVETATSTLTTTTTASWADISANYSLTITSTGGIMIALFMCSAQNLQFDFKVDGTRLGQAGAAGRGSMSTADLAGTTYVTPIFFYRPLYLAAGSHTVSVQWRVPASGTGQVFAAGINGQARFYLREL